jgi:Na+(H+)/acetate symporter ActP
MVFVFYLFEQPPLLFQKIAMEQIQSPALSAQYAPIGGRFERAYAERKAAATGLAAARHNRDAASRAEFLGRYRAAQTEINISRGEAAALWRKTSGETGFNDTNYIFLSFVTKYLPAGVVGLVIAVIFSAAMSAASGEVNSLATVTVIDIYRRHFRQVAPDRHYLWVSRLATAFWGAYAVFFAQYAKNLGSLVEAVNMLGSLFYGSLLGVFVLAFFFKKVGGHGAFFGMLAGEIAIFSAYWFTGISFLWYNVVGCLVVIVTGVLISLAGRRRRFTAVL